MLFLLFLLLNFNGLRILEKTPLRFKAQVTRDRAGALLVEVPYSSSYRVRLYKGDVLTKVDSLPSFIMRGVRILPLIIPEGDYTVEKEYAGPLKVDRRKLSFPSRSYLREFFPTI